MTDTFMGMEIGRGVVFSEDRVYRYMLHRKWGETAPLNVIMLNPSTADHEIDDPTIRRVMGFAEREGFRDVMITNLFALRSTDPKQLLKHPAPIGPENDQNLRYQARCASAVWIAWGSHGHLFGRSQQVLRILRDIGTPTYCLGQTKGGEPRHPLYQANTAQLNRWPFLEVHP